MGALLCSHRLVPVPRTPLGKEGFTTTEEKYRHLSATVIYPHRLKKPFRRTRQTCGVQAVCMTCVSARPTSESETPGKLFRVRHQYGCMIKAQWDICMARRIDTPFMEARQTLLSKRTNCLHSYDWFMPIYISGKSREALRRRAPWR